MKDKNAGDFMIIYDNGVAKATVVPRQYVLYPYVSVSCVALRGAMKNVVFEYPLVI